MHDRDNWVTLYVENVEPLKKQYVSIKERIGNAQIKNPLLLTRCNIIESWIKDNEAVREAKRKSKPQVPSFFSIEFKNFQEAVIIREKNRKTFFNKKIERTAKINLFCNAVDSLIDNNIKIRNKPNDKQCEVLSIIEHFAWKIKKLSYEYRNDDGFSDSVHNLRSQDFIDQACKIINNTKSLLAEQGKSFFIAQTNRLLKKVEVELSNMTKRKPNKDALHGLLDSYLEKRAAITTKSGNTKEFKSNFFKSYQKSFTQKTNAVKDLRSALNGEPVDLSNHLSTLRDGELGKTLRKFIKSDFGNIIVGRKVNTVSEFVRALQEKNSLKYPEKKLS